MNAQISESGETHEFLMRQKGRGEDKSQKGRDLTGKEWQRAVT